MGLFDDFYANNDTPRVPNPSHRHAAPSAPWPWLDLADRLLDSYHPVIPPLCTHEDCGGRCWKKYPKSKFPTWTELQVAKCGIQDAVKKRDPCRLYFIDVDKEGRLTDPLDNEFVEVNENNLEQQWKDFVEDKRPPDLRVRALFIEDLSGPVLQMLGAKFKIEPFFWASSLNWIPTCLQEDPQAGEGDHITICFSFLHASPKSTPAIVSTKPSIISQMMIDPRAPLPLSTGHLLVLDFLSVHMIRNLEGSTIISYHPGLALLFDNARDLHERTLLAGHSVYWQKMCQVSSDPTFLLFIFLWHAMYAWDEALEKLYTHICALEIRVIGTNGIQMMNELHVIRAHQLHYHELLEIFRKSVEFVPKYFNPMYDNVSEQEKKPTRDLLERECHRLLAGIERLEMSRELQSKQIMNLMNFVSSSANLECSGIMQRMTENAVRDSSDYSITNNTYFFQMKQIAYMTMVFLPASFVAAVFRMNVKEITQGARGTLSHFVGAAVAMTVATIWVIVAYQCQDFLDEDYGILMRLFWPVLFLLKLLGIRKKSKKTKDDKKVANGNHPGVNNDIEMPERRPSYIHRHLRK